MRRVTRVVTPAVPFDVLTTSQAAALLQVSTDTLLEMPVPFVRVGAGRKRPHRRYLRTTLLEWMRRRQEPP